MSLFLNRRGFLIAGGLTALASTKVFGANERLRVGVIGAGGRMKSVLDSADQSGVPFEIVSVCDVYAPRCAEIKARGNAAGATEPSVGPSRASIPGLSLSRRSPSQTCYVG